MAPFLSLHALKGSTATGDTLVVHRSSSIAERAFCSRCGSKVFYRFQDGSELMVSAGLFDSSGFVLSREIFHDRKPAFYGFTGDTEKVTALRSTMQWLPVLAWRRVRRMFRRSTG